MASRSLNRVILIGNLTRDPELKYTPAGTAVCTFGVATNRSWTTADGKTKDETQFHRIVAWQKLAELCGKLLSKGRKVFLEGRLTYRSFIGRDGQERSITEIVLDDFIVFGDGKRTMIGNDEAKTEATKPPGEQETTAEVKGVKEQTEEKSASESQDVDPNDIPF